MKRFMLFTLAGEPGFFVLGAVEVPGCFNPTDKFVTMAAHLGFDVVVAQEDEISDPPPPIVLLNGKTILADIRDLAASLN